MATYLRQWFPFLNFFFFFFSSSIQRIFFLFLCFFEFSKGKITEFVGLVSFVSVGLCNRTCAIKCKCKENNIVTSREKLKNVQTFHQTDLMAKKNLKMYSMEMCTFVQRKKEKIKWNWKKRVSNHTVKWNPANPICICILFNC